MRLQAYGINASVRTPPSRDPFQLFNQIIHFCIVENLRARGSCHLQSLMETIDGNDSCCAKYESAADRELANGPASPNGYNIAGFDLAIFRGHVARRENVR